MAAPKVPLKRGGHIPLPKKSKNSTIHIISRELPVKKPLIWMICLILIAGLFSLAGALGKRGKEPVQLTYHLAAEELLPGPWTATSFAGDRPAILVTDEFMQFLDPSGQILAHLERSPQSRFFLSKEGNFIGIQELSVAGEKRGSPRMLSLTLYSRDGRKLWSLKQPLGGDEPVPSFYLSDPGRVVMVQPLQGIISFLDEQGSLAGEVRLFPGAMDETERGVACAFSADGNYVAVNILLHHARPGDEMSPRGKGRSYLVLFDSRGKEIWRRELEQEISDRVAISPNGQAVVAGAYSVKGLDAVQRATYLYDAGGELIGAFDFPFRQAAFSWDGRFLLLGQKNSIHLLDTQTGQVLWEKMLPGEAGQIRALDLSPDGSLALAQLARGAYLGPRFVYASPRVLLFDEGGHQVWQGDFPEDSFIQPVARFLEDGSGFLLAFHNRYLIYEGNE